MKGEPDPVHWWSKRRVLIAAVVIANCLPWLLFRLIGSPWEWPTHFGPDSGLGSLLWFPPRADGASGTLPFYADFYYLLASAQVLLFSIWAAFSRKALSWRFCYLLGLVAILARMHLTDPTEATWEWAKYCLFKYQWEAALVVTLSLLFCRMAGLQLHEPQRSTGPSRSGVAVSRRQLTILSIVWWTVGVGFFLGLWTRLVTNAQSFLWLQLLPRELGPTLSRAALSAACLWLVLGTRYLAWRAVVFALAMIPVTCWDYQGLGFGYQLNVSLANWKHVVTGSLPMALWVCATLSAFRIAGYRLQWQTPRFLRWITGVSAKH